jgi:glycosyltransferase involved in cell wall biosynthesis
VTRLPLRVAFVNHTAELGGGEIALLELVRNLDVSLISPIVILFANGPLVPLLRETIEVHVVSLSSDVLKAKKDQLNLRTLVRSGPVLDTASFMYRLRGLLRSLNPNVVYTNSLKADLLGGVTARLLGIPVVWHVRDRISPEYIPGNIVKIFRIFAKIIPTRIIANSASTLFSISAESMSQRDAGQGVVIHDGVDIEKYTVHDECSKDHWITIGLIGRISPWKGQDVFIEAVRLIYRYYPNVRFQIIGSVTFGETDFCQRIQQLLQMYKLTDIIELVGFESNIPRRLSTLDIVVHASVIPEPFGQVIIEAMAAGKPVIATNGGGVPEIVCDGINGILIPMKDAESMALAMTKLIVDKALCSRMGSAARSHVSENFTISKTVKAVENLLLAI